MFIHGQRMLDQMTTPLSVNLFSTLLWSSETVPFCKILIYTGTNLSCRETQILLSNIVKDVNDIQFLESKLDSCLNKRSTGQQRLEGSFENLYFDAYVMTIYCLRKSDSIFPKFFCSTTDLH